MTRLVEFFTALLHKDMQRKIPLPEPFFFTILHQKVNPLKLDRMGLEMVSENIIALEFSQSMVTVLLVFAVVLVSKSISKPQLFNWKMCLVSEKTAVFTPHIVILVTVTNMAFVCT